jgi:hypothetical protein
MNLVRLPGSGAIINLDNACVVARDGSNEIGVHVILFQGGLAFKIGQVDRDYLDSAFQPNLAAEPVSANEPLIAKA